MFNQRVIIVLVKWEASPLQDEEGDLGDKIHHLSWSLVG